MIPKNPVNASYLKLIVTALIAFYRVGDLLIISSRCQQNTISDIRDPAIETAI